MRIKNYKKVIAIAALAVYWALAIWYVVSATALTDFMGEDRLHIAAGITPLVDRFLPSVIQDLKTIFTNVTTLYGRYFPFFFKLSWVYKFVAQSVFRYRLYIAIYTFIDIALMTWLIYRLNPKTKTYIYVAIFAPLMLNLYQHSDGSYMYTYQAMNQKILLCWFIALHFQINWIKTKQYRYFVPITIFSFIGCLGLELGYLIVFPTLVMAFIILANHDTNLKLIQRLIDDLKGFLPVFIGVLIAFILYVISNRRSGGVTMEDTLINFSVSKIAISTLMQLSAGLPLRIALLSTEWIPTDKFIFSDFAFPIIAAVIFLAVFLKLKMRFLDRISYGNALILAIAFALPPAILVSLTKKFQAGGDWASWYMGWVVTIACTFGYIILMGYLIAGVDHYIDRTYKTALPRVIAGITIAVLMIIGGAYSHAAARLNSNHGAERYEFVSGVIKWGALDDIPDDGVIVTDYVIWGDHIGATQSFFGAYTGQWYLSCYVSKWQEVFEELNIDGRQIWVYNYLTSDPSASGFNPLAPQMVITGETEDWELNLGKSLTGYFDADSIDENTTLSYIVYTDAGDESFTIGYDDITARKLNDKCYEYDFPQDTYINGFTLTH